MFYRVDFTCEKTNEVQVISDIDDTIKASDPECHSKSECLKTLSPEQLGRYMAGVDNRLEFDEIYPGLAEFQLALSLGPAYTRLKSSRQLFPRSPIPLSARPRETAT